MDENKSFKQTVMIRNRNEISLDGVVNVEGFDEGYVSLASVGGRIVIEGADLKIEGLTKEDGKILISGKIDAVLYTEEKTRSGIFSRFFK